jgi:hypothetical protein
VKNLPVTGVYIQGFHKGYFQRGNPLQIAYTYKNGDHIRLLSIPPNSSEQQWQDQIIYDWQGMSKCIDVGDIDRDGDQDILFSGRDAPTLQWLRNDGGDKFSPVDIAASPSKINHRCRLSDINGDGRLDAVFGHKGRLVTWYEQPEEIAAGWTRHVVADSLLLLFDPLSLNAVDMDSDGDTDLVIGEHTPVVADGDKCRLFVFENSDRKGTAWRQHLVYKGDEHHQGAFPVDIDQDGDQDILSVGYRHSRVLLYENRANR